MIKIAHIMCKHAYRYPLRLFLLVLLPHQATAETITIGKGSGIVWEGMPFNVTLNGPLDHSESVTIYGLLSISNAEMVCMGNYSLKTIGGYNAYPLTSGVGLIPRAIGTVSYYTKNMVPITFSATLGLPETRGLGENSHLISSKNKAWCIPASMSFEPELYSPTAPRTANISGSWVVVTDGTQKTAEITLRPMYAGSYSRVVSGDRFATILPTNISLRISNLECTVNTPTHINFGSVAHDPTPDTELGALSYPLTIQCSQDSDRINANINLQFRALSGLYQNSPTKLSLMEGGGYITGEIDKGVTGSGSCAAASGVSFDNQTIRIGHITSTQLNLTLTNQVTWRLCSAGPNLPLGNVDAAAEMLVTFN
ncbi:TPA: hypothetical protein ACKP1B_002840 [Serratia fonticola]